jgi:hypothetical protein
MGVIFRLCLREWVRAGLNYVAGCGRNRTNFAAASNEKAA